MTFSSTSRNICLDGVILSAECLSISGEWNPSELSLDSVLGNLAGRFYWGWTDFSGSAREIVLDGCLLRAQLLDLNQTYQDDSVDLNEYISNKNGVLTYVQNNEPPQTTAHAIGRTVKHNRSTNSGHVLKPPQVDIQDLQNVEQKRLTTEESLNDLELLEYSPLSTESEIRLLKIELADARHDPIRCSVETFDLHACPEYDALSYTWGNPFNNTELDSYYSSTRPIICNESRMLIKQNLFDAMQRLRKIRNVDTRLAFDKTPLILAAEEGNLALVHDLLVDGADITAVDDRQRTALHHAAENGYKDIVNVLINAGVSIDAMDVQNQTAADIAQTNEGRDESGRIALALKQRSKDLAAQAQQHMSHVGQNLIRAKYVWIDAICINQSDDQERAAQVAQMGQIFAKAQKVIAWLGREKQDENDTSIADLLLTSWRLEKGFEDGMLEDTDIVNLCTSTIGPSETKFNAMRSFSTSLELNTTPWILEIPLLNRSWFTRAWIIQEVIIARRLALLCGPFMLSWDALVFLSCCIEEAVMFLARSRNEMPPRARIYCAGFIAVKAPGNDFQNPAILLEDKRRVFQRLGHLPSMEALSLSRNAGASDKRDKVFSILPLSTEIQYEENRRDEARPLQILPNYLESAENIYLNVSKGILSAYGLKMLSFVMHRKGSESSGLPSWAIDLRVPQYYTPLGVDKSWIHSPIHIAFNESWEKSSFRASGDTRLETPWQITENNVLTLQGFRWDTVDDVANLGLNDVGKRCSGLSDWVRLLSPHDRSPGYVRELLWKTLIAHPADEEHLSLNLSEAFVDWLKLLCLAELTGYINMDIDEFMGTDEHRVQHALPMPQDELTEVLDDLELTFQALGIPVLTTKERETWSNFFDHVDNHGRMWNLVGFSGTFATHIKRKDTSRRLFRTQNLAFGAGPELVRPGDMVFIIPETSVPYILRPVGYQKYTFIGEAYIHGIMHGQAIESADISFEQVSII